MNMGHAIFKRMQRLQQGDEEVPAGPTWLPPGMRTDPSPKEAAGLYDPGGPRRGTPEEQAADDWEERTGMVKDYEQARLTKTWMDELAPDEVDEILNQNLDPSEWSDSTKEKLGEAFDLPPKNEPIQTPQYAQGTSNVNNMGLRLFMAGQGLRKPKRKKQI